MSAAFTPGPWRVEERTTGNRLMLVRAGYGNICLMGGSVHKEANAHLIAAAPALYAVCEALDDFICNELAGDMPTMDFCQANPEAGELLLNARRALALARGEQ